LVVPELDSDRRRRGEAAHSLPEAVIAALVVGIMTVSLYAGFSSGFTMMRSTREDLRANQILVGRLESLRLYRWDQLQDTNYVSRSFTEYYDPSGLTNSSAGTIYAGKILVRNPDLNGPLAAASYRSRMLEVTVKVYWTNNVAGEPTVRSRQLQTYFASQGMRGSVGP